VGKFPKISTFLGLSGGAFGAMGSAFAQEAQSGNGRAVPWQTVFQEAVTPNMTDITWFHDILLYVITAITLFVLALLVWVMIRYNERSNPIPSKTTHNTLVEVAWTIVPILILVGILIPSFKMLTQQRTIPVADMTIKAIGHQWYWSYEYPDLGDISFDAVMLEDDELKPGQPRLLEVDNHVVVPVNKTIRIIATADDVIHAWAVPSFGVKIDTIPGRLNEAWFRAEKTGTYYGQCSELCGIRHAFMPIAVDVVSEEDWVKWQVMAKEEFAAAPSAPTNNRLASVAK